MRRYSIRIVIAVSLVTVVWCATGCVPILWASSDLLSFAAGWVLREVVDAGNSQTICYRNGVPIDCSEVPSGSLPTGG
jgi:hypothetical protein